MGRFRSFLRRALKPAAMVGIVGLLSLSLIVTTPSNAEALQKYPKIPPTATFVMGAAKTVAPVAMAAVSLSPVGWGLRLAQLGFLAYSTSDMWMPFFTGAFGAGNGAPVVNGVQYAAPTGGRIHSLWTLQNVRLDGDRAILFDTHFSGSASTTAASITAVLRCKKADGTVYNSAWAANVTFNSTRRDITHSRTCDNYETLVGAVMGGPSAHPSLPPDTPQQYPGPNNVATVGVDVEATGFDPLGEDVGYQGRSECVDSAGSVSWVYGPTVPGNNGAMLMPACEAAGKGHGTGRTIVEAFKPDGTKETVWDTGANPLSDPATPLCDPGRATSGCVLEVTKDGKPCATGDVECENWSSESKKEGNTRYGCKLGPYTLPLSACSLLERAYHPGGSPLNDENTDGDPSTSSPLGPNAQPAPVRAPTTTGTGTGTAPVPGGSGQTGAGADEKTRNCFPTGWAVFNPIEWVLKPIRCAAEPTQDPKEKIQASARKYETKAPFVWMTGAGGMVAGASSSLSSSCPNWTINVGGMSENVVCDSSFTQAILNSRGLLFGAMVTAMFWPLIRSLWYAVIPVLRPAPTS